MDDLRINLDFLQEEREIAHLKDQACKIRMERKYNSKVVQRKFKQGDLVLRKV
ncbi:hypothetical protein SESBI_25566 [Sesbania bispinosa]|nr:hypothetical protein SESBI_25566 [Sesbania bispinosa]